MQQNVWSLYNFILASVLVNARLLVCIFHLQIRVDPALNKFAFQFIYIYLFINIFILF